MVDAVGICLLLKGLQKDSSYFDFTVSQAI